MPAPSLSEYALSRLRQALRRRREKASELNEVGVRLLDWAVYEAYCDARDLGVGDAAKRCLEGELVEAKNGA